MVSRNNFHFVQSKHLWFLDVYFVFWNEKMICTSRMYMVCNLYLENDFVPFFDRLWVCLCYENKSSIAVSSWVCWGKLTWKGCVHLLVDSQNTTWHLTIQLQVCASHVIFHELSTCELVASKSRTSLFFTDLHQTFTLNSYIKSYRYTRKWLTKYNQIWHRIKTNKM